MATSRDPENQLSDHEGSECASAAEVEYLPSIGERLG